MAFNSLVDKIVTLKLITGEEILAAVVDTNLTEVLVKHPLLMVMVPDQDNQGMVAFAPWIIGAPETKRIPILNTAIIAYSEASKEVRTHYLTATNDPSLSSLGGAVPEILTAAKGGRG